MIAIKFLVFLFSLCCTCFQVQGQDPIILDRALLNTWFSSPSSLATLNVSSRNISLIESQTFTGFTNLKSLQLNNNKIFTLDIGLWEITWNFYEFWSKFFWLKILVHIY